MSAVLNFAEDVADNTKTDNIASRYELLVRHSRDIILFVRSGDGLILEANMAALNAYGYTYRELLGLTLKDLRTTESMQQVVAQIAEADTHGAIFETVHRRKDGSTFPVEVSSQGTTINGIRTLINVIRDISRRKRAEEALRRAKDDLELRVMERTVELNATVEMLRNEIGARVQAVEALREKEYMLLQQNRLAAMGEMIHNIAHQWRQPLNVLGLLVQQLQLFYDLGSFSKEYLDESVKKSMGLINHMSATIDDFRNFFKPDKDRVEFAIQEVVLRSVSLVEESFRNQQISIDIRVDANPVVCGFPNEYSQVLLNILMNAKDALLERRIGNPRVLLTISEETGRAVVTIADNAGGITEEVIARIFEPYYTTKGPDKGTGVGLFMSKAIIEKNMDGRLTVRNTGEGAEFRIEV